MCLQQIKERNAVVESEGEKDGERGVEGKLKAEGGQRPGSRPLGLPFIFTANRREMESPAWA